MLQKPRGGGGLSELGYRYILIYAVEVREVFFL